MWFTETSWPPIFLFAVLAAVAGAVWVSTQRGRWLVALVASLAAAVVAWVVERQIVTEAERVEAAIHGIVDAFARGDLDETLSFISPQAETMRNEVSRAIAMVDVTGVRITDEAVTMHAQETLATSRFRVNATLSVRGVGGGSSTYPTYWELKWQLQGGEWRVTAYQRLDVLKGEPINAFSAP